MAEFPDLIRDELVKKRTELFAELKTTIEQLDYENSEVIRNRLQRPIKDVQKEILEDLQKKILEVHALIQESDAQGEKEEELKQTELKETWRRIVGAFIVGFVVGAFIVGFALFFLIRGHEESANYQNVPSANYQNVTIDNNAIKEEVRGVLVRFDLTIYNALDPCMIVVFYYAKTGENLIDHNGEYVYNGMVAVTSAEFTPSEPVYYKQIELFIPYSELHLGGNVEELKLRIETLNVNTNTSFAKSEFYPF